MIKKPVLLCVQCQLPVWPSEAHLSLRDDRSRWWHTYCARIALAHLAEDTGRLGRREEGER